MRTFSDRHIGISDLDEKSMKDFLGVESLEQLIQETIPDEIRTKEKLKLDDAISESQYSTHIYQLSQKNRYFKNVITDIKKVLKLKNQNHTYVTRMLGKACSDNSNFMSSIHCIITSSNYESAIIKTIKAGGCNCSRAIFCGSYFSALKKRSIPLAWIKKTIAAQKILEYL